MWRLFQEPQKLLKKISRLKFAWKIRLVPHSKHCPSKTNQCLFYEIITFYFRSSSNHRYTPCGHTFCFLTLLNSPWHQTPTSVRGTRLSSVLYVMINKGSSTGVVLRLQDGRSRNRGFDYRQERLPQPDGLWAIHWLVFFSPSATQPTVGLLFYSRLSGFSLLAYEVTWSHTTTRHSR